ncbi:MAG: glycosyltransferase family 4 protein [Candidatus Deferrimicrobium sp.]
MKILWIARTCPWPANDGEKLRVYNLLKHLGALHDITLVCRVMNDEENAGLPMLRSCCAAVHGVPVPRSAGVLRKAKQALPFLLSRYPVSLATVFFPQILEALRKIGGNEPFDVVQVEHSSLSIYLDHVAFSGDPKLLVTMHNIDFVRNARVVRNMPFGAMKCFSLLNELRFREWECRSLRRFDGIIAMSEIDMALLKKEVPGVPVHVVGNGVDTAGRSSPPAGPPAPRLIFVASMDSEANHDGALFFLKEIFPLLKKSHPGAGVTFVGRNPRKELSDRRNGTDIAVTGNVEDVSPYYRDAAVAIVPLRSGGGTRLKILESMAAGVPVVSTSIGCEGLEVRDGEHLLVADLPRRFADCIGRLLTDTVLRDRLVRQAREKVETDYDWRWIARRHDAVYHAVAGY